MLKDTNSRFFPPIPVDDLTPEAVARIGRLPLLLIVLLSPRLRLLGLLRLLLC